MRWGLAYAVIALAMACGAPSLAHAAPGDLDPGFGDGGTQVTDFGSNDSANAAALESDGGIAVVGTGSMGAIVARYQPDGVLDPAFGQAGSRIGDLAAASDVAELPDGSVLVLGYSGQLDVTTFARYTPSGALDPGFGNSGIAVDQASPRVGVGTMAIQPDGRIVAVGTAQGVPAVMRYNADGSRDASFGSAGVQTIAVNGDFGTFADVALQPDGKIVAAGFATGMPNSMSVIVGRFNPDGAPDTSFGSGGLTQLNMGIKGAATGVALQPDGKIVVSGYAGSITRTAFVVLRYLPDGQLDPGFASGGRQTTDFPTMSPGDDDNAEDNATAVALQPDGRIVVSGSMDLSTPSGDDAHFAVVRYEPDGRLDASFGSGGERVVDVPGVVNEVNSAMALRPDGRIVLVGSAQTGNGDVLLARLEGGGGVPGGLPGAGLATPGAPLASVTSPVAALSISSLRISPRRFRVASLRGSGPRRGARIAFRLGRRAGVRFTITHAVSGRRVDGRCQPATSRNKGRRPCTRRTVASHFTRRALAAGQENVAFSGREGGRSLTPGRYLLNAIPVLTSNKVGRSMSATFSVTH